ncbi:hypothetical protein C0989_009589 [Termitomyces sp. Mn162]|nr:hypothetical protein C0989_009589 [Termitomyces sp. Mn162]
MTPLSRSPPVLPIIDENLLLSDAIEFNWKNNPNQPFYTFSDSGHDPQIITHLEFGRAAHRMARLLRPDSMGQDGEVVALIAHTDASHPISSRMLIKTSCHRVLATNAVLKSFVEDMQAHLDRYSHKVEITEIPPLAAAYPQLAREDADYLFEPYPILRRPSPSETCIIMHSSGSTGIPKPIRQTHLACTRLATLSPEWKEYSPHLVLGCMALPAFNPFAVVLEIFHPAFTVITIALFPPVYITGGIPRTPSPQAIIEHAKATIANALVAVPPVFIESWAKSPETIEYLKSLEFIVSFCSPEPDSFPLTPCDKAYAGLNLIPKIGNQLASAGVRLQSIYGGTELGIPVSTLPNRDVMDWEYVRFIQDVNVRWISLGNDIFELHLLACLISSNFKR